MSRYDEIRTMAREQHHHMACSTPSRLSHHKALCYGAEWADKTMIDKAVDWLKDNWREYVFQDADESIAFIGWEGDFRKAMRE